MGTQQISITIPDELARAVRAKVASAEYSSESEVVQERLTNLLADDAVMERWLRDEVATAYDAFHANPGAVCSAREVRARLAEEHNRMVNG